MRRPNIGEKLKPRKAVKSLGLSRKDTHTVTDVCLPHHDSGEPMGELEIQGDGGWWVKTDKLGDEWYALIYFELVS